jgi:tetratricopeptide (TPR) repeat protein
MLKHKINIPINSLLIFLLTCSTGSPQEVDIVPYLKMIESGNVIQAKGDLAGLKEKNPNDPSVMFLDGILTENGQEAIVIYQNIVDNYPKSKYADAALYRVFSYYYALGLYDTAKEKLKLLAENYPNSPYIKVAEQNLELKEQSEVDNKEEEIPENVMKSEENYKFTVQAGAFTNLENAKNLNQQFAESGIFSQLVDKTVAGTTFHVVYAGKFEKYEDAENFLAVINSKFNVNGSIIPIPPK